WKNERSIHTASGRFMPVYKMISTVRLFSRLRLRARIQTGRIEATIGRNFVEMKKKSTSRHLWIGRIASAYAAGSASSSTITVETATTTSEFVNADCRDSVPVVELLTSL